MINLTEEIIDRIKRGGKPAFGIKELAQDAGVSVAQYARDHGIPSTSINAWSNGRSEPKGYILLALWHWDRYEELKKEHEKMLKLLRLTVKT